MLLVRDDDILVHSREFAGREFDRFKGAHELLCQAPGKLLHAPAILVSEIQDFPQCIEYVQTETIAGRMQPELHGYKHIDYASLSIDEVREHLQKCIEWYYSTFNMFPSNWYTPFGAGADSRGFFLNDIAKEFELTLYAVDTQSNEIKSVKASRQIEHTMRDLRAGMSFNEYCTRYEDTMWHWWARGSRINRLVEIAKYGSWNDASVFNKDLFK